MPPGNVQTGDASTVPGRQASKARADWTLAYVLIAAIGAVALLALITAPVAELLGDSQYAVPSTLHGVAAMTYVIVATIAAYLAYRLYTGELKAYRDLRILAGLQTFLSLVTIMFGNWIYVYYRQTGGPRSYFKENMPEIHEIFFEFKEFVALFTLPLLVAASFVLWREKEAIAEKKRLRQAVAIVLVLAWAFLMLAFGLGAAITKLRSV